MVHDYREAGEVQEMRPLPSGGPPARRLRLHPVGWGLRRGDLRLSIGEQQTPRYTGHQIASMKDIMTNEEWAKLANRITAEKEAVFDENARLRAEVERLTALVSTVCHADARQLSAMQLQLSEERERCAQLVEDFEAWIWPDKKSEAYREAGDCAGPLLIESMKRLADEIRKPIEKPKGNEITCSRWSPTERKSWDPHCDQHCNAELGLQTKLDAANLKVGEIRRTVGNLITRIHGQASYIRLTDGIRHDIQCLTDLVAQR